MLWDEQGLGKTITAINAADEALCDPVLCIVPAVVLWNWQREWHLWSPKRKVQVIDTGRCKIDSHADVVVMTHGLLLSVPIRRQVLQRRWDLTILDEAHYFRSPTAKRTRAFFGHPKVRDESVVSHSERVWLLTGTPMPNYSVELWPALWGLFPERILHSKGEPMAFNTFRARFTYLRQTQWGLKPIKNQRTAELRERIKGTFLRRLKKDHLRDLPPVRFEHMVVKPTKMPHELAELDGLLDGKVRLALEGAKVDPELAFRTLAGETDFSRYRHLCGLAKAPLVADLIDTEMQDHGLEQVVVFAHHRDVMDAIEEKLIKFGTCRIDGDVNSRDRDQRVLEFQNGMRRVALLQLQAGGVGITLTAASEVVFAEFSPVPGENAQAVDRVHRIGQRDRVRARFMSVAGTCDELLASVLRTKTQMIKEVLE